MTLAEMWASLGRRDEAALIGYTMAGSPTLEKSLDTVRTLAASGADAVEIGLPFSDPIADGPVIQAASQDGLKNGATLDRLLDAAAGMDAGVPLLLMSYLNPLLARGAARVCLKLARAGFSGLIVPDLPPDGAASWRDAAADHGLDLVFLAVPTSSAGRLKRIASASSGFIYCVGLTGTTGGRRDVSPEAAVLVRRLRKLTDKPLAVAFGVSSPEQVRALASAADGVIVGSRFVSAAAAGENLAGLAASFKTATRRRNGRRAA